MREVKLLATCALIAVAWPVPAAPLPDAVPIEQFATLPAIERPQLSPDGTKIAAMVAVNGKQSLVIGSLINPGQKKALPPGEVEINWFRWVTNDWLVVGLGDTDKIYDEDVYVTRVAGVNADMTKVVPIGWKKTGQVADDVLWIAKDGSPRILLSKQTGYFTDEDWFPSVWEADVSTGESRLIVKSQMWVHG